MKGRATDAPTQQSLNGAIKTICDVMRRPNCAKYVPEPTWILFLRILDEHETFVAEEAAAVGEDYTPALRPSASCSTSAASGAR